MSDCFFGGGWRREEAQIQSHLARHGQGTVNIEQGDGAGGCGSHNVGARWGAEKANLRLV